MKYSFLFIACLMVLVSCADKKLSAKTFTNNKIEISWYEISEMTTSHDFVDLRKGEKTENIIEANTDGIYDVIIIGDTVVIKTLHDLIIYKTLPKVLDYHIKIDSSITTYQYLLKYNPEAADAFKEANTLKKE